MCLNEKLLIKVVENASNIAPQANLSLQKKHCIPVHHILRHLIDHKVNFIPWTQVLDVKQFIMYLSRGAACTSVCLSPTAVYWRQSSDLL